MHEGEEKMKKVILAVLTATLLSGSASAVTDANKMGESVRLNSFLVPGKTNIVEFYNPSDRATIRIHESLSQYEAKNSGSVHVIRVIIPNFNSPAAKQFGVKTSPYFRIYDKNGLLEDSDKSAYQTVLKMITK